MSASSLLEQVQARPACLGHCVRQEGARLGLGPPPPVGPSRGGASHGPGFGPHRPAAPCSLLSPALPASPWASALTGCAAFPPQRASFFFLVPFLFLEYPASSPCFWRVLRFFLAGPLA